MRLLILCLLFASPLAAVTYAVGPGQAYTDINNVPLENLAAGDIVEIHWRSTPYAEKFVIAVAGTAANPVIIRGVPNGSTGALPIITGDGATTRQALDYWGENRGVIKLGGASAPSSPMPEYITIENLEIRSAHANYTFTDDGGSSGISYADNAAAIYIETGQNITIRNCILHDSGNGLFCGPGGGVGSGTLTENIYIGYNYIHDNGNTASAFEHNSYCESSGIVYEFNRYGPTKSGASGNALKDRSANCVIRYNWIEGGNRQLDLVDAQGSGIDGIAGYDTTYVYDNVLIEPNGAGNSQIIHYGGDSASTAAYRNGTLHLYNNTIYSTRSGNTTLIRLSTNSETCDARNNIIHVSASGSALAMIDDTGTLNLRNNWLKTGYVVSHGGSPSGTVNVVSGNIGGSTPGWTAVGTQDFTLTSGSGAVNAGTALNAAVLPTNNAVSHYVKHQQSSARPVDATLDIGAYEYGTGAPPAPEINILRGTTSIAAGGTDNVGTATVLTYTVENTGTGTLTFTGANVSISAETGCAAAITTALAGGTVAAAGSDTFTVTVTPAGGAFSFDILVESDDADESSYVISVSGNTVPSGGGGTSSGGGSSGGCTAGDSSINWFALLALLSLAVLGSRTSVQKKKIVTRKIGARRGQQQTA